VINDGMSYDGPDPKLHKWLIFSRPY